MKTTCCLQAYFLSVGEQFQNIFPLNLHFLIYALFVRAFLFLLKPSCQYQAHSAQIYLFCHQDIMHFQILMTHCLDKNYSKHLDDQQGDNMIRMAKKYGDIQEHNLLTNFLKGCILSVSSWNMQFNKVKKLSPILKMTIKTIA